MDTTQPTYKTPSISSGIKVKVIPTSIESPSSIHVQIAATEGESQEVVDAVNDFYTNLGKEELVLANPTEGLACVAQFSEDESWYRAIITNITDNQATVIFVDYGNTDTVRLDSLKEVTDDFLQISPFAIRCKLRNASEPSAGWPDEVCSTLESSLLEEDALVAAEFHTTNIPAEADLFVNTRNVLDMLNLERYTETVESDLIESTETSTEPIYPTPLPPEGEVPMRICTSCSPTYFYVQLLADDIELGAYSARLQEEYTQFENLKNRQDQVVAMQSEVDALKVMQEADIKKPEEELMKEAKTSQEDNETFQAEDVGDEEEGQIEADFDSAYEGEEETDAQPEDSTLQEEAVINMEGRHVEGQLAGEKSTCDRNMSLEEDLQVAGDKDSENSQNESKNIEEKDHHEEAVANNIIGEDNNDSEAVKNENNPENQEIEKDVCREEEEKGSDTDEQDTKETITDMSGENENTGRPGSHKEKDESEDAETQKDALSVTKKEMDHLHEEMAEKITKVEKDVMSEGKHVLEAESEENVHESPEDKEFEVAESENLEHDDHGVQENVEESPEEQKCEVAESENLAQVDHGVQENAESTEEQEIEVTESENQDDHGVQENAGSPEEQEIEVAESENLAQDDHGAQENAESPEEQEIEVAESENQDDHGVQENAGSPEEQEIEAGEQTSTVVNFNAETIDDGASEPNDTETEQIEESKDANAEKENERADESQEVKSTEKIQDGEGDSGDQVVSDREMQPEETNVSLDIQISDVKIGMACIVKCAEDSTWCRATVNSVAGSRANVLLIDYGKFATVEVSNMMQVSEEHLTRAPYAYLCQLDGIREPSDGWTSENNEIFTLALKGSNLKVSFVTNSEPFKVKIVVGEDDILQNLPWHWSSQEVEETAIEATCSPNENELNAAVQDEDGLNLISAPEGGATEKEGEPCRSYPVRHFTKGQSLRIYASEVRSLLHFYLQFASEEDKLTSLADEVNEFYSANSGDVEALKYPEVNRPCVAQYTDEEGNAAWYRAQISDINDDVANVLFVDYGNSECVNVDELKEINEEYLKVAPYALCCQVSSDIPDDLLEWFTDVTMNAKQLEAEILEEDTPMIVKLLVDGKPVEELAKHEMDGRQMDGKEETQPEEKDEKDKTEMEYEEPVDTKEGDGKTMAEFPDPDTPDVETNQGMSK